MNNNISYYEDSTVHNWKATCSLIISLLTPIVCNILGAYSLILPIVSISLGITALKKQVSNRGCAIAGIIISALFLLFVIITVVLVCLLHNRATMGNI